MELAGKGCVITGGASGIGFAVAELFVRNGAKVVLADVNAELVSAAADRLGQQAIGVPCDVSENRDVEAMVGRAAGFLGGIDVLVNNAGFGLTGNVVTIREEDWDRLMAVNVKGMFLCAKHIVPLMSRDGGGSIINTTSYTAVSAIADRTAYVTSKGAVSALTRAMALDHAKAGIRVNAVAPGTIDSAYFDRIFEQSPDPDALRTAFEARAALKRMGKPDEIAEAFLFLASDRSLFATGSVLTVDGGSSIGNHLVA